MIILHILEFWFIKNVFFNGFSMKNLNAGFIQLSNGATAGFNKSTSTCIHSETKHSPVFLLSNYNSFLLSNRCIIDGDHANSCELKEKKCTINL